MQSTGVAAAFIRSLNGCTPEKRRCTPLHSAVQNGQLEVVKLLLASGIDIDARAAQDFTPLHIAAQNDRLEVAKLLLTEGANVDAKSTENAMRG
ncbi:MAG: ankyrin repeat domain-containing protein [Planctomycetota bacterium]